MRTWKTVRVFISSTFRDMQAERDHLVRVVFPRLREQLLQRRIHLLDVDLRWGVTSEQDASEVCREIITECRPRFLCMLGGRYGTIPDGRERSITSDEVHFGVLDESRGKTYALFYFRHGAITEQMDKSKPGSIREPRCSEKARMLAQLKRDIRNSRRAYFLYHPHWKSNEERLIDLNEFGDRVAQDILATIDDELGPKLPAELDEFAEENNAMEEFVEERSERFVLGSRAAVLNELLHCGKAFEGYACLTGAPGSGKSALLAHYSQRLAFSEKRSTILVSHFVGASVGSSNVFSTLRRLCHELKKSCPEITASIPDDLDKLRVAFRDFLGEACIHRRVVILLDAVNQFETTSDLGWLSWLPGELPANTCVILSAPTGSALEELGLRFKRRLITLEPLEIADGEAIIEQFRLRYRKRFTPDQRASLLAKTDAGLPLYLLTALEELRTLGTYEEISQCIVGLPPTTQELFTWILDRLKNDNGFRSATGQKVGEELVSHFAALVGASRHGLSQLELDELLGSFDHQGNVSALLYLLRPYLMRRGELIDFYHGQFRAAASRMCLSLRANRVEAHQTLAEFFLKTADPDGDRTWRGPQFVDRKTSGIHALQEVSFHAYQFALESGSSSLLFSLADDTRLRQQQFESSGSPMLSIELIGYSLEVAAAAPDPVKLVHLTMLRTGFAASLARSYLYRLPELVREEGNKKVMLAKAIAQLIPEPAQRRLGLLLIAWMLRADPVQRPLVFELIGEALRIELQADVCQSALLLEMTGSLFQEGFVDAASLLDLVPSSHVRQGYLNAWAGGSLAMQELLEHAACSSRASLPVVQSDLEEFQRIVQFTHSFGAGLRPWPNSMHSLNDFESKLCETFGPTGAAGAYFTMACDQMHSGNDRMAEALITRGIYLCATLQRPALRTLTATSEMFGTRGEFDMAREQQDRVHVLMKSAQRISRTPQEMAWLVDEHRELMMATHDVLEQQVLGRSALNGAGAEDHADAFILLSNLRLLVAEGQTQESSGLLSEVMKAIRDAPQNQQPGLLLGTFFLARACRDDAAIQDSAKELAKRGLHLESLFSGAKPSTSPTLVGEDLDSVTGQATAFSREIAQVVAVLVAADPRCIAAVALSLRISGKTIVLVALLWHAAHLGPPIVTLDPLLCELVHLPSLTSADLRQISDEMLYKGRHLTIPSGLGLYYYPGIMLASAWVGGVFMLTGFFAARDSSVIVLLAGAALVAGAIGGFADLWIWQRIGLWERPEKSRRFMAELGTITAFCIAVLLIKPHLPRGGAVGLSILTAEAATAALALIFGVRGLLFRPWHAKAVAFGAAITCSIGMFAGWLALERVGGENSQQVLGGLFLAGSFVISQALNILPKHLACVRHFGLQGDFEREEDQQIWDKPNHSGEI